jgi:hypothetical protein
MNNEQRLKEVLLNLISKIEEIEPHVNNMCKISQIHGVPYRGPNYNKEMIKAKQLLEELK